MFYIIVCKTTIVRGITNENGKNWIHSGCSGSKSICSGGTCGACTDDASCVSAFSGTIASAIAANLKCHPNSETTDGTAPSVGAGGCAVCLINLVANPSGRAHSGCSTSTPICDTFGMSDSSTTAAGTDPVCKACTNDGTTDTCNPCDTSSDTCGGFFKVLGTCKTDTGQCNCVDDGAISTDRASPDRGCPSQNPSCVSNVCACGSAGTTTCLVAQTCSNPANTCA